MPNRPNNIVTTRKGGCGCIARDLSCNSGCSCGAGRPTYAHRRLIELPDAGRDAREGSTSNILALKNYMIPTPKNHMGVIGRRGMYEIGLYTNTSTDFVPLDRVSGKVHTAKLRLLFLCVCRL